MPVLPRMSGIVCWLRPSKFCISCNISSYPALVLSLGCCFVSSFASCSNLVTLMIRLYNSSVTIPLNIVMSSSTGVVSVLGIPVVALCRGTASFASIFCRVLPFVSWHWTSPHNATWRWNPRFNSLLIVSWHCQRILICRGHAYYHQ